MEGEISGQHQQFQQSWAMVGRFLLERKPRNWSPWPREGSSERRVLGWETIDKRKQALDSRPFSLSAVMPGWINPGGLSRPLTPTNSKEIIGPLFS